MKSKIHNPSICELAKQNKKNKLQHLIKKILIFSVFIVVFTSCKDETNEKVKEATKAVSADMKVVLDSAKVKASKIIDTAKVKQKARVIIGKGAEKLEEGAKKLKESVKK